MLAEKEEDVDTAFSWHQAPIKPEVPECWMDPVLYFLFIKFILTQEVSRKTVKLEHLHSFSQLSRLQLWITCYFQALLHTLIVGPRVKQS